MCAPSSNVNDTVTCTLRWLPQCVQHKSTDWTVNKDNITIDWVLPRAWTWVLPWPGFRLRKNGAAGPANGKAASAFDTLQPPPSTCTRYSLGWQVAWHGTATGHWHWPRQKECGFGLPRRSKKNLNLLGSTKEVQKGSFNPTLLGLAVGSTNY